MSSWPSYEDVHRAAQACMKRKRGRLDAILFRMRYGERVFDLTKRLHSGYLPGPGTVFVTDRPKYREIHAADFRDRVVHHLLHAQLEPIFEKSFISDSYACRVGKGTHAAMHALQQKMRHLTRGGKVRAYALKMDVRAFFPSIHRPTLLSLLDKKLGSMEHAESIRSLVRTIVNHDPVPLAQRVGPRERFERVPQHKRLGASGPDRGLPIGNLTSQFFGNVYLNALDQFVKCTLGVRHYVRYVDDWVILDLSAQKLRSLEESIRKFLAERLHLVAHEDALVRPVSEGVDFVGYIVRPNYVLSRRRVLQQADRRLAELEEPLRGSRLRGFDSWPIQSEAVKRLRATWMSYHGHLVHSDSRSALKRLWQKHTISRFHFKSPLGFEPRFPFFKIDACWRDQVDRLQEGLKKSVLVVKVGRYAEVPRFQDRERLGLPTPNHRKGRRLRVGVLYRRLQSLLDVAFQKGLPVALALEMPTPFGRIRARALVRWLKPQRKGNEDAIKNKS
ncbi:MAG: group II intron reverse transcriptase domain-containing protein [Myxococcaceae bacterium]|nr:group II intron reverse transcriptase domain-containing protein [Myxococcaceae bacterium]